MIRLFIYNSDFYNVQISRCEKDKKKKQAYTNCTRAPSDRAMCFFSFVSFRFQSDKSFVHRARSLGFSNLSQSESSERFNGAYWSD